MTFQEVLITAKLEKFHKSRRTRSKSGKKKETLYSSWQEATLGSAQYDHRLVMGEAAVVHCGCEQFASL